MKAYRLLPIALLITTSVFAQTAPQWSYSQPEGPNQWGSLPGYSTCQAGAEQSPLDIESGMNAGILNVSVDSSLESLMPRWNSSAFNIVNNGHTVQVNYDAGSSIDFEGNNFNLKQFHFHSPSEHILNGRQYPLETHFVHQAAGGNLLVIGIFFKPGAFNAELEKVWKSAPAKEQSVSVKGVTIDVNAFLPTDMNYYNYRGSLTTPPCSEGVNWIVLKNPIEASAEQLQFLQKHMGGPNNRPIQPQDGRMIGTGEL